MPLQNSAGIKKGVVGFDEKWTSETFITTSFNLVAVFQYVICRYTEISCDYIRSSNDQGLYIRQLQLFSLILIYHSSASTMHMVVLLS